ncbi:hypothetical protein [Alloactinosynnema sp. L-07]|uniref:hypothetical protein n=1 Tax=Alloactinosynnema sp. L-07 TaxID=1653480 RepID=UPI00065EF237|nr:hypothetical protein [Alloactinosynnema sp. L-07]CRK55019.1 hypothetical protein [Alloactinosynnema sp. L-07]
MIRGLVAAAAAGLVVLATAAPVAADPYDNGNAATFTLAGTCDGAQTTIVHGPGNNTVGFIDGRPTIARKLVFYAPDGISVVFVHEGASYPALAARHELLECDLVLSLTGNRVTAWVQTPSG